MSAAETIRVLVVDDEPAIREAYCEVLANASAPRASEAERLRARLFERPARPTPETLFDVYTADRAEAAVEAFRERLEGGDRFDVVFLDMRMPPGPDGAWAASRIRELDASVDIVIATAYSDVDPAELSARIPPADKLFYLQKPFHAHEMRQLAVALGRKARVEAKMRRLAYFDSLTGLPNRDLLREQMAKALALAKQGGTHLCVLFVDLDNFKRINDTLGHAIGDEVLCVAASRLCEAVRETDTVGRAAHEVGRMGGDEFLLILPEVAHPDDAAVVATRIARSLQGPMQLGSQELYVTPTIGISVFPRDGEDIETLIRNADLAMYFAKRTERGSFKYYDAAMNASILRRLTLENELRGAVERGELSVHYQPQVELGSGHVTGMEALLRWKSRTLGEVPTTELIAVAEESGLIVPIGNWVMHAACFQAQAWIEHGLVLPRIAVNVSAVQIGQPDFVERVRDALEQSELDPTLLEIELTESALTANMDRARELIQQLKTLGVGIAIDDFGVGYSNMSHLKQLAIDRLKMDRSFIKSIDTDERDRAIAAAIIAMAKSMKLRVTAEGIEDDGQIEVLESQGCDEVQGFLIARPMTVRDAGDYLRAVALAREKEEEAS